MTSITQRALGEDYYFPWLLLFFPWEAEEGNVVSGSSWQGEEAECNICRQRIGMGLGDKLWEKF